MLKRLPILLLFSIAVVPHIYIGYNLIYLDDIPVLFILGIFILIIFQANSSNLREASRIKYLYLWILLLAYTLLNPSLVLGYFSITTDFMRYSFLFSLFLLLFYIEDSSDLISRVSMGLLFFLSIFSILSFFFKIDFGTDAYNYWNIGFNSNNWGFTPGRVNGLQAGGPNSFGDLICILTLKVMSDKKINDTLYSLFIALGYLGCFFTYSRSSILVLLFFTIISLVIQKRIVILLPLLVSILITINFGLFDRFASESETDGINDRIEMQSATTKAIQERSIKNSLYGYGFNQVAVVRSEVKPINDFPENLRPTGPHNGYVFQLLNYGYIGLILFLSVVLYPIAKLKSFKIMYLLNERNMIPIAAFLTLNLGGDLFQNQSVAWIFWLYLFEIHKESL